jgi:hypothetical protein
MLAAALLLDVLGDIMRYSRLMMYSAGACSVITWTDNTDYTFLHCTMQSAAARSRRIAVQIAMQACQCTSRATGR